MSVRAIRMMQARYDLSFLKKDSVRQSGFSLIELVIVIALLSVLAFSVQSLLPGKKMSVEVITYRFADDIRTVQALSMSRHERYRLNLARQNQYAILNAQGKVFNRPTRGKAIVLLEEGVTFTCTVNDNRCGSYLIFDSLGVPYFSSSSSEEGALVRHPFFITLKNDRGFSKTIKVLPETGYVEVLK